MNTNPNSINILCYGDSNTWGQKPDKTGRFASDIRWTGRLQNQLGDKYYIIEEGLGGRTTDLDRSDRPGRNGKEYLMPCLLSHNPLHLVILMLGSNDLKLSLDRSAENIALATSTLISLIRTHAKQPNEKPSNILLVSPIGINVQAVHFNTFYKQAFNPDVDEKRKQLCSHLEKIAMEMGCGFFDASTVASPGEDGLHLSQESHEHLAQALKKKVDELNISI